MRDHLYNRPLYSHSLCIFFTPHAVFQVRIRTDPNVFARSEPKNWPHVTFYFDHVPHLQLLLTYLRICLGRVVLSLTSAVAVVILGYSSPTYYQRYFIILHYSYIYSNYRYKSYLLYLDFEVSRSNTSVEKFHCGQRILFADSNMIFIISLWAKTCLKDIGIVCKCLLF